MITTVKGFSGIDKRQKLADGPTALSDMLNFRVLDSGSIEKRPPIIEKFRFADNIDGVWSGMLNGKEIVAVVAAGKLYIVDPSVESGEIHQVGFACTGKCTIFEFNGALYIKSLDYYGKYDGNTVAPVEGYVPCVAMSCKPSGEGEPFEQINLLSNKRRQLFSGDGQSMVYKLAEEDIDSIVSIKIDGAAYQGGYTLGEGRYLNLEAPPCEGLNNVEIVYEKTIPEADRDRIMKCTNVMLFGGNSDGRVFLWGNDRLPNHRFHSDLANGTPSVEYFPVNAFTVIGNSKINCIVQQYDRQLIFTKNQAYYSFSELRDDGMGNLITSFPVFSLNGSKGCLIQTDGCIIDNRPVTLCDDGLNAWESTSVVNERNAVCISAPINEVINTLNTAEKESVRIFDFQAKRELYLIIGDNAYVFNYGNGAWYRFNGFSGEIYSVCGSKLYFSRGNRLYIFGNGSSTQSITCFIESPYITNGQGDGNCDVSKVDIDLYVKGNESLSLSFVKNGKTERTRNFKFLEGTERFLRISVRPSLKRAMPFKFNLAAVGNGSLAIHGITLKTRKKERSKKYGIQ